MSKNTNKAKGRKIKPSSPLLLFGMFKMNDDKCTCIQNKHTDRQTQTLQVFHIELKVVEFPHSTPFLT